LCIFGFNGLSDNTVVGIVKTLLFHPTMFYLNLDNKDLYDRINGIDHLILKLIQDMVKKSEKLDNLYKLNIEKSLILLLFRYFFFYLERILQEII
jgi:hypothetical protein